MRNFLQSKKSKAFLVVAIVVIAVGGKTFLAYATQFIDSFTDTSRVANTWNTTVNTGTGEVALSARSCDDANWFCSLNTTCPNTLGDGNYIIVKRVNSASAAWKTTDTDCDKPTCGTNGTQDGDNLVTDNTVNFGVYPARDICKAVGGRLPTVAEQQCMYINQASFGNNFELSDYWSSTEGATNAWCTYFGSGSSNAIHSKTTVMGVRCVMGW